MRILFLLVAAYLTAFSANAQIELSPEEWQEDLAFLKQTVHQDYPFLFKKVSAEEFDAAVQELHDAIPQLAPHEVVVGFARIVAMFDTLFPCRQGSTDSELLFYLLFHFGLEDDPMTALRKTLEEVARTSEELGCRAPFRCTAALTDGQSTYAIRHSTDDHPPSLYWQETGDHTLIVSEPLDTEVGEWQPVPPSTILVTRDGQSTVFESL